MGFGGISLWQLLIILAIVVLIFGTRKLKNMGSDLGGAVKGFKDSMKDGEEEQHRRNIENRTADNEENGESRNGQPKNGQPKDGQQ